MSDYYREAVQCALEEVGLVPDLTPEQWDEVGDSIASWVENEYLSSIPTPSADDLREREDSEEVARLKQEIVRLDRDIETFRNSVKQRRNADQVWIENGSVMYR